MRERIRHIASLARLVRLDGMRRHALLGLILLALLGEAGGLLFFDFIPRDIGRASLDYILAVSWLTGLVFLFFHAVQVMAWDEERRVIHTLLARPISRGEYVLGVFFGLAQLLLLLNLTLGGLGWGILQAIRPMVLENYFPYFSNGFYLLAWAGIYAKQLALLAVVMLFSGMVRGSFTVLLMSISYYFTCNGLPVVRDASKMHDIAFSGGDRLFQVLTLFFPDFNRLDFKELIISDQIMFSPWPAGTAFGVMAVFAALVLWAACAVYQRRDLK